ncbi:MAG: hypothetical protein Kow0031_05280 [Anaerolineae bacterium]
MNANILVVEDRADWRDILCTTLARQGLAPQATDSFAGAVAALEQDHFSLAVIDPVLDMANRFNRDGLSVIQKIREMQPHLPVIVLTGSLTHDMEVTLQQIFPQAPVLFKEKWDARAFGRLVTELIGQPSNGHSGTPGEVSVKTGLTPPAIGHAAGRPRVLLVENRQDWQDIVATILHELGVFWRVAANAQEALAQLDQQGFHLVILDLKLQQASLPMRSNEGWLLLDHLVERHPKTQVLILSGKAGPGDVADLLTQYPVIGFVEKQNFSPQAIKKAVGQVSRAPALKVQTLGQFQIWRDGQAIGVWERPQAETVTKLLLARRARGGRAVAADELITRLWPEADEESGRKKLLPLISNARRTLEPDIEPRDSSFILRASNGYYFDLGETVTWDLLQFREYLRRGQQLVREERWDEAIAELEKGRDCYKGDFLVEDRYADWAIDLRREVTSDYCRLLTHLADGYAAQRRYINAVATCEAILAKDPLLESIYRRLMRYHACNGEKGQALKVYRDCLTLFEEMFGESPTPATRQLHRAIANDEPVECAQVDN